MKQKRRSFPCFVEMEICKRYMINIRLCNILIVVLVHCSLIQEIQVSTRREELPVARNLASVCLYSGMRSIPGWWESYFALESKNYLPRIDVTLQLKTFNQEHKKVNCHMQVQSLIDLHAWPILTYWIDITHVRLTLLQTSFLQEHRGKDEIFAEISMPLWTFAIATCDISFDFSIFSFRRQLQLEI